MPTLVTPDKANQVRNMQGKFSELERILNSQLLQFSSSIEGLIPEMVLVFEIAGTIDEFFKAVEKTPGMHYLMEFQDGNISEDNGFYYRNFEGEIVSREIEKRIFVTLNNQSGIQELLNYWSNYRYGNGFSKGVTKFRTLFEQLIEIRPYNLNDRLLDTGFREYLADEQNGQSEILKFEIEFVYHTRADERNLIIRDTNFKLNQVGGNIIESSIVNIESIQYFGAVAQAPISAFNDLSSNTDIAFLQSHRILLFKPIGQLITRINAETEEYLNESNIDNTTSTDFAPIAGILDGLPVQNHIKLQERLVIDDPDEFANLYPSEHRNHGTSMASLIVNGDFQEGSEIMRKLYLRPILKLDSNNLERLPSDRLILDLLLRAIVRIFVGEEGNPPVAPQIKVINFSIGDIFRPFIRTISSWAKLMDYLSYKYKFIFIISAGNYSDKINLPYSTSQFEGLNSSGKEKAIYKALFEKNFERKILTPGESVNSLTVGGYNFDNSEIEQSSGRYDPNVAADLPSPISRIGYGFNRSLKPDVLFESGRILYRTTGSSQNGMQIEPVLNFRPPGIKMAIPGQQGSLNTFGYSSGTSVSTALLTNTACKLYEVLENINLGQILDEKIPKEYYAVLLKALLVHYADKGKIDGKLSETLDELKRENPKIFAKYLDQNIGNGVVNKSKVGFCTDHRITLLGFGKLKIDEGQIFIFPLPASISGRAISKKITITLAWLSPINCLSGKYKMAQLFFDNIKSNQNDVFLDRSGNDFNIMRRGTLQHDVLENSLADVYVDGSQLKVKVSCRGQASGLKTRLVNHEIEYGLAVSLEIAENPEVRIYDEIKTRIDEIKTSLRTRVRTNI
jgi:Subtilase family